jgi:hypothetical protein
VEGLVEEKEDDGAKQASLAMMKNKPAQQPNQQPPLQPRALLPPLLDQR